MSKIEINVSGPLDYFKKNYDLSDGPGENIKLNGSTLTKTAFIKKFIGEEKRMSEHIGERKYINNKLDIKEQGKWEESRAVEEMATALFVQIKKAVSAKLKKEIIGGKWKEEIGGYNFANHCPIVDIRGGGVVIFDAQNKKVLKDLDFNAWKLYINSRPKKEREMYNETIKAALIEYNPFTDIDVEKIKYNGQSISKINAHVMPEWRKKEVKNPELPENFKEFMEFLFPHAESLDYVYHWLYYMLVDRNEAYLVLNGNKGVGKTTFAQAICSALVGIENYNLIDPKWWESRFNGELKYRRLCYFDEHEINEDNISRLKAYANSYLSIEEKNVSTQGNLKNFCSYIISNNPTHRVKLEYDDRRFSVPIINTTPINQEFSQEWLDDLHRDLMNTDYVAQIGFWILKHGNKGNFDNLQPYKSDLFFDLVEKSLANWQKFLVDLISRGEAEQYDIEDWKSPGELGNTGRVKIENFLASYKDRDGDNYGYLKQASGGRRLIIPADKYQPEVDTPEFDEEEF